MLILPITRAVNSKTYQERENLRCLHCKVQGQAVFSELHVASLQWQQLRYSLMRARNASQYLVRSTSDSLK